MTWKAKGEPLSIGENQPLVDSSLSREEVEEGRRNWKRTVFILGTAGDSLIVMPLAEARRLAALQKALWESRTWGELLSRVANDSKTLAHLRDLVEGELPDAATAFSTDDIPGHADGDWPLWPAQAMLDWLPSSVQALGSIAFSNFNGEFLVLDDAEPEEVIARMAAEGIECREDTEGLVASACGY
jgi:hypothetical protein